MATAEHKIEGLAVMIAYSPLEGYSGAILDIAGGWTGAILEAIGDAHEAEEDMPERAGLAVWEGSCVVTTARTEEDDDPDVTYRFNGAWRAPSGVEMSRLAEGRMPLRDVPMPEAHSLIEVK